MIAPGGIVGNAGGPYSTFKGALDIHNTDLHNVIINDYIHAHDISTTLVAAVNKGDTDIDVVDASGFAVGNFIHLGPDIETIEPIHPEITAITVNNIELDRPLDNDYVNGTPIVKAIVDLKTTAGTLAAPISYKYFPQAGRIEHIHRIISSMTHGAAADDSLFGSIAALTNGVVFRAQINGVLGTFTNWKANRDFILDMYDVIYSDKAGPGLFGTRARGSFSELDVAIVLDQSQGDFLEILIQDNLTTLNSFRIKVQGHLEGQ